MDGEHGVAASNLTARVAVATLATGAMWYASTGANHLWPLAWVAPVPLLVALFDLDWARAAVAAFGASAIGALNLVLAYRGLPPALLVGAVLFIALPYTAVALAWRALARRLEPPLAVLAYPALVVIADYLISAVSPNGTFGSTAYSQSDVLPVLQVASITGLWGISFLLALVAAALAVAWREHGRGASVARPLAMAAVPLALALLFGGLRLAMAAPAHTVRVCLAASDSALRAVDATTEAEALPVVRAYAERVSRLTDRHVAFVVLPEKFVGVTREYEGQVRSTFTTAARLNRTTIVAGLNVLDGYRSGTASNRAVVFGPDGGVELEYDKMFLVPGLEANYQPGSMLGVLRRLPVPVGVAICKDLDFVPLGRAYARAGIGLLLVPAWDFVRDGWLHSRMALVRAVEGGYALARSAAQGRLTIADWRGAVIAERASGEGPEVLLVADVPVAAGGTFYSAAGDWLPGTCVAVVMICTVMAHRRPRRSRTR